MNTEHQFGLDPLACHSFSADGTQVALSPNNNEVHIFQRQSDGKWDKQTTLSQHDLRITSIDWAPKTNRIVTCSADRNAYVWSVVNGVWTPSLVILRINRAATCVRWSPKENKFAVGCGAKLVNVCYFEEANNWWISKHIKKPIKSTVTAIDWHPNNLLIACGSTDFKVKVFSAFVKEVDQDAVAGDQNTPWGGKPICGNLVGEWGTGGGGWVHDVCFSPDGNRLAWVSHDSTIAIVDAISNLNLVVLKTRYLPFLTCIWTSNDSIVAAGHDCCPMLFAYNSAKGRLAFVDKIDKSQRKESDSFSAMRKFKDMDKYRDFKSSGSGLETQLETLHQNTITELRAYRTNSNTISQLSSIGLDGKMVIWNLKDLPSMLSALKL